MWLQKSAATLCKLFHVEQFGHWSQTAKGRIQIADLLTYSKVPFKNICIPSRWLNDPTPRILSI